jgi:hypothetical protein
MTGLYNQTEDDTAKKLPHERPLDLDANNQQSERWGEKRTLVRALEGSYGHLYKSLVDEPRVYSSTAMAWKGCPGLYGKHVIRPQHAKVTQSIECHLEVFAPGRNADEALRRRTYQAPGARALPALGRELRMR